ncbi:uncharacterized protein LOC111356150 [Spodoptera litura]|uniref:Uncharacterized protein LOC111356150 n=1 Tax=Spodoptera litura TaxID=69820 RepID=A0A9J7E869_SPOLT|nr:uncharacterized protein LOC111356150 [Spodoptera litura]
MSFLYILLVSSTFYIASARPNKPVTIAFPPIATFSEVSEAAEGPVTDRSGYFGLPGYLVDMSKLFDQYNPTFDPNIEARKQDEKKTNKDLMGYFNSWFSPGNPGI